MKNIFSAVVILFIATTLINTNAQDLKDKSYLEAPNYGTNVSSVAVEAQQAQLVYPSLTDEDIVVANIVVTDAPYNVDNSGVEDCTDAVQQAISDLHSSGNGTLYFPAGKYRFDGTLTTHAGVCLRGDWKSPLDGGSGEGTIFMIYSGRNDESGSPFIHVWEGAAAIKNLSFWYPEQTVGNIVPYPPTIKRRYFGQCMISKLTFYNSYFGIEQPTSGAALVSEIYGTFLKKGIQGEECLEYPFYDQIFISPEIWANAPGNKITNAPDLTTITDWCQDNTTGMLFGNNDNVTFYDITVKDAKDGIFYHEGRKGGDTYGLKMKMDASEKIETLQPVSDGVYDLDRHVESQAHNYNWPTQWKPARTDVLINACDAPYNAIGDAATDNTAAIQQALDAAGNQGGGIVYLPTGEYLIDSLTVPSGVELRGTADFHDRGPITASGLLTTLFVSRGENSSDLENEAPAISLSANSSLRGICILYFNQTYGYPTYAEFPVKSYPWTIRGLGPGINIQYVNIKRAWDCIDLASHDCSGFVIQDTWFTPFNHGLYVGGGTDGGHIHRVLTTIGASEKYPGYQIVDSLELGRPHRKNQNKGQTLTPNKFEELWNKRQINYFKEIYKVYEATTSIGDTLRPFKVIIDQSDVTVIGDSYFELPTNYFHFSAMSYVNSDGSYSPFDMVTKSEVIMRKVGTITAPSTSYPICYEFDNKLYLEPYDDSLDLNISYLRCPTDVILDYYIDANGVYQYLGASSGHNWLDGEYDSDGDEHNSGSVSVSGSYDYTSQTTESEWNEDDQLKILEYVLRDVGISVDQMGIYQYADAQKNES